MHGSDRKLARLFHPVTGKVLGLVDDLVAAVVALAGVALGVLVGEDGAGGLHHRRRGEVLAGDDVVAFAHMFGPRVGNGETLPCYALAEFTVLFPCFLVAFRLVRIFDALLMPARHASLQSHHLAVARPFESHVGEIVWGVFGNLARRKIQSDRGGGGFDTPVHTDRVPRFRERLRFHLYHERGVPVSVGRPVHADALGL